jgi:hypothetical protein
MGGLVKGLAKRIGRAFGPLALWFSADSFLGRRPKAGIGAPLALFFEATLVERANCEIDSFCCLRGSDLRLVAMKLRVGFGEDLA